MFSRFTKGIAALSLVATVGATSAQAAPTLQFDLNSQHATGASLSFTDTDNDTVLTDEQLKAVQLDVDTVTGIETYTNDSVTRNLFSFGGASPRRLDFTTGNFLSFDSASNIYTFAAGGSIMLSGGVDLNNDGDLTDPGDIPLDSPLVFQGQFTTKTTVTTDTGSGAKKVVAGVTLSLVNSALASYYGLDPNILYSGTLGFNITTTTGNPNGGAFKATGTALKNGTLEVSPTPEPGTLMTAAIGAVALCGAGLRRKARSCSAA